MRRRFVSRAAPEGGGGGGVWDASVLYRRGLCLSKHRAHTCGAFDDRANMTEVIGCGCPSLVPGSSRLEDDMDVPRR